MPREYKLYLEDILLSISKINNYINSMGFEEFSKVSLIQDAVIRNLEIIGESVKNIPQEIKEENSHIEWRKIAGLRDVITHAYFAVDLEIVWEIIEDKLPELEKEVRNILR